MKKVSKKTDSPPTDRPEVAGAAFELEQEKKRSKQLEDEVRHLTRRIEEVDKAAGLEHQAHIERMIGMQADYDLLSQKYDRLVSANIDLSNQIEANKDVDYLKQCLDEVRNKINVVLRSDTFTNEVVIVRIRREIEELRRARVYLGKALFDLGMLYLRLDRMDDALAEFRAARELGVEDPKTNRLLNFWVVQ